MTPYSMVLGITIAANLILLGFVAFRANRQVPRLSLVFFLAAFIASHALTIGRLEGTLGVAWTGPAFASLVLGHTALALFAITFLHAEGLRHRLRTVAAIVGPGVAIAALGAAAGRQPSQVFQPATDPVSVTVNGYLVACFAIAFAESLAVWRQSPGRSRETLPLAAGTLLLIVAGPVYGFEFAILRFADLTGTNPAVPLAGALFAAALMYANPLRFRGGVPEGRREIPWTVPGGAYLLDETRPKYAQALFVAASRGSPSLAILSEPEGRATALAGVDAVRLPPGPPVAAVLAATAGEFLHRHPTGAVLVNDVSYAVANSGLSSTVEALRRTVGGMPSSGRLIVSLANLNADEREAFGGTRAVRVPAPDVETEVATILETHVGAATDALTRAALARGKRVEDIGFGDLSDIEDFVLRSLSELRASADEPTQSGWSHVSEGIALDFQELRRTSPLDRPAPGGAGPITAPEIPLIRAAEILAPASDPDHTEARRPLGAAVRDAFLGALGPAGEPVYRRVMKSLRKDAASLRPEDIPHVAELAEEALADLGGAIDVEDARRDLVDRARRLRMQLNGLAGGDP